MSAGQSQDGQSAAIREEVRRTIQQLNEMAQSERNFDQFCEAVLSKVVKITGAHGALLWQVNGNEVPRLTHQSGEHPNAAAQKITSQENPQHSNAVLEVVTKQVPMGLTSEAFTGASGERAEDPNAARDASFLMLFSPVYNRAKKCCGTLELLQRGDISPAAQEGYLRFLSQIAMLFQRWHEQQNLAKLTENADKWHEKLDFITEVHRSIDPSETAFAIANEARRLLNCDRVSVAKWNGRRCKVTAISSQDRFDNRANVVRKLGSVATSSVSADTPLWIIGSTEGIAPEVARQINDYLDESHSRTLAVLPLIAKPPATPDLEMRSRRKEKVRKLGALIIEYFDADVSQADIAEQCDLIVKQSESAMENSRVHGEIFLLPIWRRLGWLQQLLFRDHRAKTMTGLAALAFLTLFMIFFPKELKMKVEGVMHPTHRQTIFSLTDGIITSVNIEERGKVKKGEILLQLENPDLELQIQDAELRLETLQHQIEEATAQLAMRRGDASERIEIGGALELYRKRRENLQEQLSLMEKKKSFQIITSPIDGTVVTPQPKRRLMNFPTTANLAVLEVADFEGPWQMELKIPQNKIGYVTEAQQAADNHPLPVEFRIGTNPNLVLDGRLISVASRAVPSESGVPEFRAIVEADGEQFQELSDELRSGTGVTAKILCGKRSLGFVCFYQIIDWLRTKVFF